MLASVSRSRNSLSSSMSSSRLSALQLPNCTGDAHSSLLPFSEIDRAVLDACSNEDIAKYLSPGLREISGAHAKLRDCARRVLAILPEEIICTPRETATVFNDVVVAILRNAKYALIFQRAVIITLATVDEERYARA